MSTGVKIQDSLEAKRALLASRLRHQVESRNRVPLSFAQQRIWYLDQLEPGSPRYNIAVLVNLEGTLNLAALEFALNSVLGRHEALRTRFLCQDGIPEQRIDPHAAIELRLVELESREAAEREAEAARWVRQEVIRPFDLSADRLLRATLLRHNSREHQLILVLHHIVADEWSLKVLFSELGRFYAAFLNREAVLLPALSIQYADYALWQREWFKGDSVETHLGYWRQQMGGCPSITALPCDRPRSTSVLPAATAHRKFSPALLGKLSELAASQGATNFMVLLAAFKVLLHRYTRQEDLVIGSPVAGRNRLETEDLIGFFVNTLPLRTNVSGDPTFLELLARVRQTTIGAFAHQDLPFEKLVEELHPERSLGQNPFTNILFVLQNEPLSELSWPGLNLRFFDIPNEVAKFELTLVVKASAGQLTATIEYARDLFKSATIDRLLRHYENLLLGIVADPRRPTSSLPILDESERSQLLTSWNETRTAYPRRECVHLVFEKQVTRTPNATALISGARSLSYQELNNQANQLAHFLRAMKVGPEVPVGVCVESPVTLVICWLAIFKAGGVYVPLDAGYPKKRLEFMVRDSRTALVLTEGNLLSGSSFPTVKVVCLERQRETIAKEKRQNPSPTTHAENAAYIMYTSGSTGEPKGVVVPHRAINRLVLNTNYIQLDHTDRIAQVSNASFDAATFEIWGALLNGAALVAIPRDIVLAPRLFARELKEQGITAMFLTTALFSQIAAEVPDAFKTLRTLIVGGEVLDPKWARKVLRLRPPQKLLNAYGPTENTTFTCCHLIREVPADATQIPIGRPISNSQVYILDPALNPVPIGVAGEIYVGGDGLAHGYWHQPELTSEKFIHHSFDASEPSRFLYRTGDLGRFAPGGEIEFLGRLDGQVKIRGFRIELGEIETILSRHPSVRQCVVSLYQDPSHDKRLVAYIVTKAHRTLDAADLRCFLGERLPEYMIPAAFTAVSSLPLTVNGKVDRASLPAPDLGSLASRRMFVAARDKLESDLVKVWETILGVQPVGVTDTFFALGGHSLLAVRLVAQIEKSFGKKVPLATLLQAPTVEQLAAALRGEIKSRSAEVPSSIIEIQPQGSTSPLFFVHGAGGGLFWGYANLSHHLGQEQPVYGFGSDCGKGGENCDRIEDLAARYINDLKTVQPRGPYYLGGYCFGGNVAYEMARQLATQGEKVALLALLNCAPPNSRYTRIPWNPVWAMRFVRNLRYWANYFRQWTNQQRREFIRWKWASLKRRFKNRGAGSKDRTGLVVAEDLVDLALYTEDERRVWEAHIRALVRYQPQPYAGRVHLFRSPGHPLWCSFDPQYGWGELAKGGVQVTVVPGAHEKILQEPCVKILAQELAKALQATKDSEDTVQDARNHQQALAQEPLSPTEERRHAEYWLRQLRDAPPLLELPLDRPRTAQPNGAAARVPVSLPAQQMAQLQELGLEKNCALFTTLLAGFAAVLHRYSRSEDIVIGVLVPKASCKELGEATANLQSPMALRCNLGGDPSFRQFQRRVQTLVDEAVAHSAIPLAKIVELLPSDRDGSFARIFQVMFILQEQEAPDQLARFNVGNETSKLDLSLLLTRTTEGLSGWIEYSPLLFDESRIARMAEQFAVLLAGAAADPESPVSRLPILSEAERARVLLEWNRTETDFPRHKTLVDLFQDQVARTPDAEALVCGRTRVTYGELHARALEVASHLRQREVTPEDLVGILLDRSIEMIVGILGTLFAGAAYVPMDIAYPRERLVSIAQDANLRVVISREHFKKILPLEQARFICVETLSATGMRDPGLEFSGPEPSNLAYVIYTSGSTGKPKGVALEHRSAVAFMYWAREQYRPAELQGVLASTSICFDLSIFEIFVPLSWGGKVILAENALAVPTLPAASEISLINTVPSAMTELVRAKGVPASVSVVNLAGEPLTETLVEQIYAQTSVRKVYDLYGPTETTTYSTGALRLPGRPATIGQPLSNEQVYLLDRHLQPVPIGVPGELYIGGAGIARGYLNQPELTAERFVSHPFAQGQRLYRTGDLARWRADGNLEFIGRIDHQVKIRGFRIELGEIESVVRTMAGVSDAVVVAREDKPGDKRVVAYVVGAGRNALSTEELRRVLSSKLPAYMVPSSFMVMESLPLTSNGKVDRKKLPAPSNEAVPRGPEPAGPRNPIEEQLARIWNEVLCLPQVGIHDNFFEMGGHSLLAARVVARVREQFKVDMPLFTLFDFPSIAAVAEGLNSGQWPRQEAFVPPLAPVPRTGKHCVSFVQERLWFLHQLSPGSHAYHVPLAVRLKGKLDVAALRTSLNALIARHEVLRTTFTYEAGQLSQSVNQFVESPLPLQDLSTTAASGREAATQEWLKAEAHRPFDLASGPLIRASLLRLSPEDQYFLVVMHHTICDGWSLSIFFQELQEVYEAVASRRPTPHLPDLPIQYIEFATWQRQLLERPVLDREVIYWKEKLAGAPSALDLPIDRRGGEEVSARAACRKVLIGKDVWEQIVALGHRQSLTPFMVLMSGLVLTLHKWTLQADLVIGVVVAGRTRPQLESIIGCFMNFLPIRTRLLGAKTGQEIFHRVKAAVLEGQNHQDCPFEKIVEAVNPERRHNQNPLYNVGLLLQNFPAELFRNDGLEVSEVPVEMESALLDLRFEARQMPDGLAFSCEYRTDLFEPGTIEELLRSYLQTLALLVREPETKLNRFKVTEELESQARIARSHAERVHIAVAATFTAEPLAEPLQYWMKELAVNAGIEFAPYNQVFQQLLDPAGLLSSNAKGLNVVLVRLEDWFKQGEVARERDANESGTVVERTIDDFVGALRTAATRITTPWLVCPCPASNRADDPSWNEFWSRQEQALADKLDSLRGVHVLTSSRIAAWYPVTDSCDPAGDELGHVPYTPEFFLALATAIARRFHALHRAPHKVIVLDCDQTLWSGVCGEDGPDGIVLDSPRKALQEFMRAQQAAGMLLCLNSKNNHDDVRAVFEKRGEMPLHWHGFAGRQLNWLPKSENLKTLAAQLQLGLDSFIFVDDNPLECAEVEANAPEVITLQLPEDPSLIPQFLRHCWVFDHASVTQEDRQRAELYRQNEQREQFRSQSPTLAEFLDKLELRIRIEPMLSSQVARVAQLSQRTNQFSCTAKRHNESELPALLSAKEALAVQVSDRFGDYGLVGAILYRAKAPALVVDSFFLSCRALGRGVEHRMLAHAGELARGLKLDWVDVHFVKTERNKPALDFLESVGAQFKQALNGGYVFRFPTGFAAEVAFRPDASQVSNDEVATLGDKKSKVHLPGRRRGPKFSACRAIALRTLDLGGLLKTIQSRNTIKAACATTFVAPGSEVEIRLCEVWQQVLRLEKVGIRDNFFELGGHSLLAVRLFSEIEKALGRKLPLVTLFQAPTIEQLAPMLSHVPLVQSASLLVPIQPCGNKPPLFLIHGAGGDVLWGYANLAAHLPAGQPIYGIKSRGQAGLDEFPTLKEMAHGYLQEVRSLQPHGPYFLGGYCFGGNVAYEMARQFAAEGETVGLVALLDSAPANAGYEKFTWWRPHFAWRFTSNLFEWVKDFGGLKASDQRAFVTRKLRFYARKLKRWCKGGQGVPSVDVEEVIDPRHFPESELKLWQIHLQELVEHVEETYSGQVTLLRTRGQPLFCSLEPDFCWSKLARGGVSVRLIPGSHEHIFIEPHVRILAGELSTALNAAQARFELEPPPASGPRDVVIKP